jgi:hypothetical protein
MEHRWIFGYWKADNSTTCSFVCSIQQRKPNRYSFSNGRAIYHWTRYFQVFPYPLHIWNRKWKWHRWNFFIRFGFPDYWMDGAYYAPNPKRLRSKLWAWSTNVTDRHTDRQTDRDDRSNTQIHSWMNLRKNVPNICDTDHKREADRGRDSRRNRFAKAHASFIASRDTHCQASSSGQYINSLCLNAN